MKNSFEATPEKKRMMRLLKWTVLLLGICVLAVVVVLPGIQGRPSAETLRLADEVREAGGTPIIRFGRIIYVRFENTDVADHDLKIVQKLRHLQTLNLDNTRITDAGLKHLQKATALEDLDLEGTKVTDEGLEHLSGLKSLRYLSLNRTDITDAAVAHLTTLPNLRTLHVRSTGLTITGIEQLRAALPNTRINSDYE